MSSLTVSHQPVVPDAVDAPVDHGDDRPSPPLRVGSQLWASNGRLWTVRGIHPGGRVELVADSPSGLIGMIIDTTAAGRMVPTAGLHRASGEGATAA